MQRLVQLSADWPRYGLYSPAAVVLFPASNKRFISLKFHEQNPVSWYHEHHTQNIGLCTTTTRPPIVSGTLTCDASAVLTVNNGSM